MAPRRPEQHAAYERRLWARLSQRLRAVTFALVLSLALAGNDAHAQSSSEGAVHGVVGAIAGSAVPAFTVTLRNLDKGTEEASLGTRLGTRGSFLLSPLEPGRYELTVAASGFRPVRAPAFDVEAEQTVEINVTLRSGAAGSEIILQRAADHAEQAAEESLMPDENDDGLSSVHGLPAMETRSLLDGASHDQNFGAVPPGSGSDPVTDVDDDPDSAELSTGPSHGLGRGRRAGAAYSVSPVAVREFRVREGNYSAATSAGSAGRVGHRLTRWRLIPSWLVLVQSALQRDRRARVGRRGNVLPGRRDHPCDREAPRSAYKFCRQRRWSRAATSTHLPLLCA